MNQGWVYWVVMTWMGLLLAGIAIPFVKRKIPPNALAGFRTPRTMSDPAVWYDANAIMGKDLLGCGIVILASTGVTFLFRNTQPFDRLVLINTFVILASVTWMVGHGLWRLSKL
jgi:uncharacterized membrane protein